MSARKLEACAAVCRHAVCGHSTHSGCSHVEAEQAVCHNRTWMARLKVSACVLSLFINALMFACLHMRT